jgi:hypothetical protein
MEHDGWWMSVRWRKKVNPSDEVPYQKLNSVGSTSYSYTFQAHPQIRQISTIQHLSTKHSASQKQNTPPDLRAQPTEPQPPAQC